jgi:hypothetical protein
MDMLRQPFRAGMKMFSRNSIGGSLKHPLTYQNKNNLYLEVVCMPVPQKEICRLSIFLVDLEGGTSFFRDKITVLGYVFAPINTNCTLA